MKPKPPWWTCPACGNRETAERGARVATGVSGSSQPTLFADGTKGYALQQRVWSLACPCGHRWRVLQTAERADRQSLFVRTYEPLADEATAEEATAEEATP